MNWDAVIKHLREEALAKSWQAHGLNSHFPHPEAPQLRAEARALSIVADALTAGLKVPSE